MSSVTIRQASAADLERMNELSIQWQNEGSTIGQEAADLLPYLQEGEYLFVAEEKETIIAFIAATKKDTRLSIFDSSDPYIELDELYVAPEKRSQGVGSLLIDTLKTAGNKAGINQFHVYSASRELERGISFYARHGFNVWSIQAYADTSKE